MAQVQEQASAPWQPMAGGCYCKKIRYELKQAPSFVNCCHCRFCQARSGSAFATNAIVNESALVVTSETQPAELRVGSSSGPVSARCDKCGVALWTHITMGGEPRTILRVGTLDENEKVVPQVHFFVRSKHPWVMIPEGVTQFETMPGR